MYAFIYGIQSTAPYAGAYALQKGPAGQARRPEAPLGAGVCFPVSHALFDPAIYFLFNVAHSAGAKRYPLGE